MIKDQRCGKSAPPWPIMPLTCSFAAVRLGGADGALDNGSH
jgi:hypothetical protein